MYSSKAKVNPSGAKTQITAKSITGPVSRQLSGGASIAAGRKGRKLGGR